MFYPNICFYLRITRALKPMSLRARRNSLILLLFFIETMFMIYTHKSRTYIPLSLSAWLLNRVQYGMSKYTFLFTDLSFYFQ